MALQNDGTYRCKTVIINKYDEADDLVATYPHTYSMDVDFVYSGSVVTDTLIAEMLEGSIGDSDTWLDLKDEFITWVEGQEALLNIQSDQLNLSYGTDLVTCPIPYGDYF